MIFSISLFHSVEKYTEDSSIYFQLNPKPEKLDKSLCENRRSHGVRLCEVLALLASCEIQHSLGVVSRNQRLEVS